MAEMSRCHLSHDGCFILKWPGAGILGELGSYCKTQHKHRLCLVVVKATSVHCIIAIAVIYLFVNIFY